MRKVVVCNIVSLDGCYTGPDDDIMVMPMGGAFDAYNAERLRAADTLLLGRKSYSAFKSFWPGVKDDPDASSDNREISARNDEIDKVVVSDTLTQDQTAPWHNTRILRRDEAHEQIGALKDIPGREILVFGSHTLWSDLLSHGLVDELHFMVGHVVVGDGRRLFPGRPPISLRLAAPPRSWEGSNNVLLRYAVTPQ